MNPPKQVPWLLQLGPPGDPPPGGPPFPPAGGGGGQAGPALPADTLGLALSGGGIRSATFCLGVLQALARSGWLARVDLLSTVSGGGYIGAFLGRFFYRCVEPNGVTGAIPNTAPGTGQERVARDLADSRSAPLVWLRRHANYLSPTGQGEMATNLAGFWRNLLSIYFVLAFFFFALFGLLNLVAYAEPEGRSAAALKDALESVTPVTSTFMARVGPWARWAELALWFAVVPLVLAYWLVSQDVPEAFLPPALMSAALVAGSILLATVSPLGLVVLTLAVVWSVLVWAAVRRNEAHNDPLHPSRRVLARNYLTRWLALSLGLALGLAAFAAVDGLGRALAGRMAQGGLTIENVGGWITAAVGGVLGLATSLRLAIRFLIGESSSESVLAASRPYLAAALIVLFGAVPPLVALSFASHAAFELGEAYRRGAAATVLALVVSLLLGVRECIQFVNRSGPLSIYASRLERAFLGASNPARRTHPHGRNVTRAVPGDDVAFSAYAPHEAGGPVHIVNCAVNETVDVASQRGLRDRQAENMAVSAAGVTVAQQWHALWVTDPLTQEPHLQPLAHLLEPLPHPFLSRDEDPVAVEQLTLRQWMAISGAAIGPGMGRGTEQARALLFTLANLRLGYWWDSGLNASQRAYLPMTRTRWQLSLLILCTAFQAQTLLLAELFARFAGPWERYWHLSDGGHFENTGAYELLRRRVPFVIVCDAGEDREHNGSDLARLVRLARADLGAEISEAPVPLPPAVPMGHLGTIAALLTPVGTPATAHAALLVVTYPQPPGPVHPGSWLARRHTWLLYIKATLTGDEPPDVKNYAALHPDFPNETTLNQLFDEPQWESYRKLGEHIGQNLFV